MYNKYKAKTNNERVTSMLTETYQAAIKLARILTEKTGKSHKIIRSGNMFKIIDAKTF